MAVPRSKFKTWRRKHYPGNAWEDGCNLYIDFDERTIGIPGPKMHITMSSMEFVGFHAKLDIPAEQVLAAILMLKMLPENSDVENDSPLMQVLYYMLHLRGVEKPA